jgi:hypothetical protein
VSYQNILETAALVLATDKDPALGPKLSAALDALPRDDLVLVMMAQKLLGKGAFFVSTDNPASWTRARKLAEHMGAEISESNSKPWFLPDGLEGQQTTLMFRLPHKG